MCFGVKMSESINYKAKNPCRIEGPISMGAKEEGRKGKSLFCISQIILLIFLIFYFYF